VSDLEAVEHRFTGVNRTGQAQAMPEKVYIVPFQRFECIRCGACCRRWHVALLPGEPERLRSLDWSGEDGFTPGDPVQTIGGHPYLAHQANGDCIFLDSAKNLCRIHRRFGESAKPLGCRVYPLNITSTWFGELSVTARMDCPAVQRNLGRPLTANRREISRLANEMGIRGGFDQEQTEGLSRQSLDFIVHSLREGVLDRKQFSPGLRALALAYSVARLEELGVPFLSDFPTLQEVMPSFLQRSFMTVSRRTWRPIGPFWRSVFRVWLGQYLRRDEEVLRRRLGRIRRTWTLALFAVGRGRPSALGTEHPDFPIRTAVLFPGLTAPAAPPPESARSDAAQVWECYMRMMHARLASLQFFGVSFFNARFFIGLRALSQTYPFVLAAARIHAAARGGSRIEAEDVQYATGAVDHSWGRSKILEATPLRVFEQLFARRRYGELLAALGWE